MSPLHHRNFEPGRNQVVQLSIRPCGSGQLQSGIYSHKFKRRHCKPGPRTDRQKSYVHWRQTQKRRSGVGFEIESEQRRLVLMEFKTPIIAKDPASLASEPKLPQPYIWPQARGDPNRRRPTWRRRPFSHSHPGHITQIRLNGIVAIGTLLTFFGPKGPGKITLVRAILALGMCALCSSSMDT
jgi:hypothetical protein